MSHSLTWPQAAAAAADVAAGLRIVLCDDALSPRDRLVLRDAAFMHCVAV